MEERVLSYRRLFGRYATGVAVVLTEENGEVVGLTVNSLTSASLDPLLLLFCVRNESSSGEAILRSGRFSANVLAAHQKNIARHFAGGKNSSFHLEYIRGNGFAWLNRSNAVFCCEVETVHPGGDHRIIIGRVVDVLGPEGCDQLLVYHEGNYAMLGPKPQSEIPAEIELS
ncbi:MAG: flavin reductase family protein [Candidatus Dormibacteria bacterium]